MKIAVCIPTFNQAHYLTLAIDSALNQADVEVEVWVCNDASTDQTKELLEIYQKNDSRVHVIENKSNSGIAATVNRLLKIPKTEFIIRLDSDDVLLPDYAVTLSRLLKKNKNAAVAHGNVEEIDENGKFRKFRKLAPRFEFQKGGRALRLSVKGYKIAANICMFRRSSLEVVNFIDGRPDYTEDYDLFVRLSAAGFGNCHSRKVLSRYRVWTDKQGVRLRRKSTELIGLIRIFDEVLEPAWLRNNWNLNNLKRSRIAFAIRHTKYLTEVDLTDEEFEHIVALLVKLGDSDQLQKKILAAKRGEKWKESVTARIKNLLKHSLCKELK